jgi:Alkylmercury lyase
MLLFRDEEHIERWCQSRELTPGAVLTVDQAWRLAYGWYKDKLKPDWRRHTVEEAQELLASTGLTGAFWNLQG